MRYYWIVKSVILEVLAFFIGVVLSSFMLNKEGFTEGIKVEEKLISTFFV